jgi:peptide/nickel transport system substrate-binding protein
MLLTKRAILRGSLATLATPLLDGVEAHAQAAPTGQPLVIGSTQVPRHFNGAVQSGTATALVSTQVFASPLRYDEHWNPQPYLAESWQVAPDNLSVTLHLAQNATFHDGIPVTSADVAFTVGIIKANHPFQTMLAPVSGVDTPYPHTAIIRLAHLHPALLLAISPALMPILPKHVYGDGQDIRTHPANLKPIGSGPYRFVDYHQGESITLEKFDRFFIPGRPQLDRIVFRLMPDPTSLTIAAEKGEITALPFVGEVRDVERLAKSPRLHTTKQGFEGIGALNWLAFNTGQKPFDDVRVRQALGCAVDRSAIIDRLFAGQAMPALGPIVPSSPFYAPDLEPYKLDLAYAAKLLDKAGLSKGGDGTRGKFTIQYIPGDNDQQRNVAEYLRAAFKHIAIVLDVQPAPDFPTWAQRISNFDFDMTMDNVFNWGDPVIGVARTYLSSNIRKGVIWSNTQQYSNPRVDTLLNEAGVETDHEKRKPLYQEFQRIIVDDAPIVFINVALLQAAYDARLANLPLSIWGPLSPLDQLSWST